MTYVFNAPESPLDKRYLYHWEVLRTALEQTTGAFGPFRMVSSEFMTEQRQAFELRNATGKLTVMYLSTTPELERTLIPVRIAVDRNLSGYFVYLIRKENQPAFSSIETVDDLRKLSHGLGLGWIDVGILRSDGFKVVTGSSYDGLFEMLIHRRFDCFPRSGVEIIAEYEQRKASMPDLHIEETLLLSTPLPMYFWFSKTDEGRRLAARAEEECGDDPGGNVRRHLRQVLQSEHRATAVEEQEDLQSREPESRAGHAAGRQEALV